MSSNPQFDGLFHDTAHAQCWSMDAQITHWLRFEAALTRAMGQFRLADLPVVQGALESISEFTPDRATLEHATGRDGLPIPDFVRQLKGAAGDFAAAIHTGSTSQDVLDTALALTLRNVTTLLDGRLNQLLQALDALDLAHGAVPMVGRTRMQAALPITVSHRIAGWREPFIRHSQHLRIEGQEVTVARLAGPVGDGSSLGENATDIGRAVADSLGLSYDGPRGHTDRSAIVTYAHTVSLISGTLGKVGTDLTLMAQQGVDEVAFRGGGESSAMPHKSNPVLAELLVTLARFNATQMAGMHHAMLHEQERSGSAWMLEWMILPQITGATARGLDAATALIKSISRIGAPTGD